MMAASRGSRFTADEDVLLRRHYTKATRAKLHELLPGRTFQGLCRRAMILGLKRRLAVTRPKAKVTKHPLLAALRKRRISSQVYRRDLAKKLGYHETTLAGWEAGRNLPTFQALMDWCDALGVCLVPWSVDDARVKPSVAQWQDVWREKSALPMAAKGKHGNRTVSPLARVMMQSARVDMKRYVAGSEA